jgi:hypothetical protein
MLNAGWMHVPRSGTGATAVNAAHARLTHGHSFGPLLKVAQRDRCIWPLPESRQPSSTELSIRAMGLYDSPAGTVVYFVFIRLMSQGFPRGAP